MALLWLASPSVGAADPCPASKELSRGVLIGWITDVRETTQFGADVETSTTTVEPFRPVAVLDGTTLSETTGASLTKGQKFWRAAAPAKGPVALKSASSFLDHMGEDHCVYYGTPTDAALPQWSLLTSKPLPGVFKTPTKKDKKRFRAFKPECVVQGDPPEGTVPPCSQAELLAVTDINKNGKPEYWATDPYMWDTGLSVWEDTGSLTPLLQVCVGCSD